MHELSLGTWFIHIATLFEWTLAIIVINHIFFWLLYQHHFILDNYYT